MSKGTESGGSPDRTIRRDRAGWPAQRIFQSATAVLLSIHRLISRVKTGSDKASGSTARG